MAYALRKERGNDFSLIALTLVRSAGDISVPTEASNDIWMNTAVRGSAGIAASNSARTNIIAAEGYGNRLTTTSRLSWSLSAWEKE